MAFVYVVTNWLGAMCAAFPTEGEAEAYRADLEARGFADTRITRVPFGRPADGPFKVTEATGA